MKGRRLFIVIAVLAGFALAPMPGRAQSQLSAENLDKLEAWGCFTPAFKAAVRELVQSKQDMATARKEAKDYGDQLPDLKTQAGAAEAKVAELRAELAEYDHTDQTDFAGLQKVMNDAGAKPQEQKTVAQAYIWAYPASLHVADARQYLEQVEKKLADQTQAEKDAEAARVAAHAKLVQRAQAKDLSLAEWRDFLRDMSQDDLVKLLGRPQSQAADYWIYSGDWTVDPGTNQKAGMQVNFNAGRVTSIAIVPHS